MCILYLENMCFNEQRSTYYIKDKKKKNISWAEIWNQKYVESIYEVYFVRENFKTFDVKQFGSMYMPDGPYTGEYSGSLKEKKENLFNTLNMIFKWKYISLPIKLII